MKSCKLGMYIYFYFIAFVLTLKMDGIKAFDDKAKQDFAQIFFRDFPNPSYKHNTILSPFSLRGSLLAASFAAKRQTRTELQSLLYKEEVENFLQVLPRLNGEYGSKIRLFVNENMDLSVCVKNRISDFLQYIEFKAYRAKKVIDDWVVKATNNIVPGIWTHSSNFNPRSSFLTTVHVEYLDVLWKTPFVNIIKKGKLVNGIKLRGPMLQQDGTFLYRNLSEFGVEAIELPLTKNARMLVLQPYDALNLEENFQALRRTLPEKNIFNKILKKLIPKKLSVYFPVFDKVKMQRSSLIAASNKLNIESPFEQEADFGRLHSCGEDVYINKISVEASISTNLTNVQIGTATDVNYELSDLVFTKSFSGKNKEEFEEEEDEEENESILETESQIYMKPDETLQKLVLSRFFFAVIQEDTPLFTGTIVKYHNFVEP